MQSDWRQVTLGEFVRLQRGHDLTASEQRPGQFPVMGSAGPNGTHAEFKAFGPGVVIGRSGASMGRVHYCETDYWPHNTCLYVTDFLQNNPLFAFYKLAELDLARYNSGSAQPSLNRNYIYGMSLWIPSRHMQDQIVRVVHSIDKKIDLNHRINQTLEAMAQAIFQSWFVDFDPVKAKIAAKAEGRDPLRAAMSAISGKADAELDALPPEQYEQLAATAALFPDEMEESELGAIPAGWIASCIGDVTARVAMGPFGSDIKKDNFVEAGVPVIRGGNLTDGLVEKGYVFLTEAKADELKNANAFPGDIVITHRGTLGQVGLIPARSKFPRYVVSQSQMLLSVDRSRMSPRYLFEFIRSDTGKHLLLSNTSQVGVPAIARPTGSVKALPLVVPPKVVLDAYDDVLKPILLELTHLANTTETLAELRDALLPKLLSGDLQARSTEAEAVA